MRCVMTEEPKTVPSRIMVVDDHEAARRGIRLVLAGHPEIDVVCEAVNDEEALAGARELQPDIILMDISLPGRSGIQTAASIREVSPESRIIFVSQHDSVQIAKDAMSVGAYGYVVKSEAGHDLLTAIEAAQKGEVFVSRTLAARGLKFPLPGRK